MKIDKQRPFWRWLFLLAVLLIAAALIISASREALAEAWGASSQPDRWLRAAQIEPGNADYWYRLGRYRQLDFAHADAALAISYYSRAVAIDPRSANYWMDLAGAYEMVGDTSRAREAFEQAKSVYPISGEVAWRYGNFLLRQERFADAFPEIRRALVQNPRLGSLAMSRCWHASREIDIILDKALPPQTEVYLGALEFLIGEREIDAALAVWNHLIALHSSFELRRAFPLAEELAFRNRTREARRVWQEAVQAAGWHEGPPGRSLVWDGGFEGEFTEGGFGWRHQEVPGAAFEFDTETRHSGRRSLRITFAGAANLDFDHLKQLVPVEPDSRYHFAAYLRTEAITTDNGIQFAVAFPQNPNLPGTATPNRVGTQPWTLEEMDFTTGPRTQLVEITLHRVSSRKFDNKIKGTVWVDDVSLVSVSRDAAPRP